MRSQWDGITGTAHDAVGARFLAGLAQEARDARQREAAWHADLRGRGIALAHPDDGWVDRERNTIAFAYPSLCAEAPRVGSLVALGTPERWRVVRLTERVPSFFGGAFDRWAFVDTANRSPE